MLDGRRLTLGLLGLGATVAMAAPTAAAGATQVGETFTPTVDFGGAGVFVQTVSPASSYAMPTAGVITSWSYESVAGVTPPMKMKIVRAAGGLNYTTVGDSELETPEPSTVNTWDTRVPVKAGDLLGIYYSDTTFSFRDVGAGWDSVFKIPPDEDPLPGTTALYEPYPGGQIDVAAELEPDADEDGYGDETQDECPTDAAKQEECDPPETTITKGAPNKLDKSKVKFKFTSDEPDATFECKLDKKPYKPCTSPRKVKRLDDGKHKFKVIATDAAGNSDPSAAKDKFKVVD